MGFTVGLFIIYEHKNYNSFQSMLSSVCVSYGWISHCLEHDEYLYYYDRWWIDNNDLNQVVASSGFSLSKVGTIYVLIHQVPTNGGVLSLTGS